MRRTSCWLSGMVCLLLVVRPAVAWGDDAVVIGDALSRHAEKIVAVKFLSKMSLGRGAGSEQETEQEIYGVMIDSAGVVLCSNTQLGGLGGIFSRLLGGSVPGLNITSDISDVRVLVGGDEDELEARVLARDTELDLAWVQIETPGREFPAVDLSAAAVPEVGQRLVCVRRLGKYFDRAPIAGQVQVGGVTEKPRKLFLSLESLSGVLGMLVFTAEGKPAGAIVMQIPTSEESGLAGNPLGMMGSMFQMQDNFNGVILPIADVAKATERARATAAEAK